MNDGAEYATTFGEAGTIMVPQVETTSPDEISYNVSVSMMIVMSDVGMSAI